MKENNVTVPMREDFITYYAYNKGECKLFDTKSEAMAFSKVRLIEKNFDSDAYHKALYNYYEKRGEILTKVTAIMADDITSLAANFGYNVKEFASIYDEACYEVKSANLDDIIYYMVMNNLVPNYKYKHFIQTFNKIE